MIIEMEFDECYKTWDLRDKYKPLAPSFPLISHFNLEPSPFFSLAIFVPVCVSSPRALPPCVHLSHFFFPPFAVCLCSTHSKSDGSEQYEGSMYMWIMEEASFSLTRCVWWPALASVCLCVCVVKVFSPFSSSIIQHHAFSAFTTKPFQIMAPGNQMLIDTRPHTHTRTRTQTSQLQTLNAYTQKNRFDWRDVAWLDSFVALLHHLWPYNRHDRWFSNLRTWLCSFQRVSRGVSSLNFLCSASLPHLVFCIWSSLIVAADLWREMIPGAGDPPGNSTWMRRKKLRYPTLPQALKHSKSKKWLVESCCFFLSDDSSFRLCLILFLMEFTLFFYLQLFWTGSRTKQIILRCRFWSPEQFYRQNHELSNWRNNLQVIGEWSPLLKPSVVKSFTEFQIKMLDLFNPMLEINTRLRSICSSEVVYVTGKAETITINQWINWFVDTTALPWIALGRSTRPNSPL